MKKSNHLLTDRWTTDWLDSVVDGSATMSQRKLSSVEKRGGGLRAVKAIARRKGVHLLRIDDDHGTPLIVASVKPFKVIC